MIGVMSEHCVEYVVLKVDRELDAVCDVLDNTTENTLCVVTNFICSIPIYYDLLRASDWKALREYSPFSEV